MRSLFYKLLAVLAVSDVVFILSSGFFTVKQGGDSIDILDSLNPSLKFLGPDSIGVWMIH